MVKTVQNTNLFKYESVMVIIHFINTSSFYSPLKFVFFGWCRTTNLSRCSSIST